MSTRRSQGIASPSPSQTGFPAIRYRGLITREAPRACAPRLADDRCGEALCFAAPPQPTPLRTCSHSDRRHLLLTQ